MKIVTQCSHCSGTGKLLIEKSGYAGGTVTSPVPGQWVYILDGDGKILCEGVVGEIHMQAVSATQPNKTSKDPVIEVMILRNPKTNQTDTFRDLPYRQAKLTFDNR